MEKGALATGGRSLGEEGVGWAWEWRRGGLGGGERQLGGGRSWRGRAVRVRERERRREVRERRRVVGRCGREKILCGKGGGRQGGAAGKNILLLCRVSWIWTLDKVFISSSFLEFFFTSLLSVLDLDTRQKKNNFFLLLLFQIFFYFFAECPRSEHSAKFF